MSGRFAYALARALIGAVAAVVIGYLLLQLGGDTRGAVDYVGDLASGELGGDDVGGDVATALPRTLALAAAGAAIATLLGTCAGLVAASRRQTGTDRALCAIATLLAAAPVVWIALLAVLTLAAGLDAFPAGGFPPPGSDRNVVLAHVEHGALPALVVGIGLFGPCLLAARAAAASVTRRRTRGALMAILRLVPTGAGIALSLAMAVEATIDRPGLGSLIRRAVADSDLALAHGVLLGAAAATLAIRFVAELVVTGRPRLGAHAPGPAAGPGRADAIAAAALLVLAVALAPVMGDDPSSPASLSPDALRAPFPGHLLGTDALGRDVLGTTIEAAAPTIVRATLAALIAALIALALGGAAALAAPFRRALGVAGAAVGAVPPLPVAVLAVLALAARAPDMAPGLTLAIVTGTIVGAGVAPAVQGALEDLRSRRYLRRSTLAGVPRARILRLHVVPRLARVAAGAAAAAGALALVSETVLSALGLGDPETPTWGTMLDAVLGASAAPRGAWWYVVPPGACATLAALALLIVARGAVAAPVHRERV